MHEHVFVAADFRGVKSDVREASFSAAAHARTPLMIASSELGSRVVVALAVVLGWFRVAVIGSGDDGSVAPDEPPPHAANVAPRAATTAAVAHPLRRMRAP